MGSFSRCRSLAKPIVGVCEVAIAPMILAMTVIPYALELTLRERRRFSPPMG
jgi:hypothetical protein